MTEQKTPPATMAGAIPTEPKRWQDEIAESGEPAAPFKWQQPDPNDVKYIDLKDVLDRAFAQAATGKGAERHGQGQAFSQQPMQKLIDLYGAGFALGQAAKKMQEAQRLPTDRAVYELLGAINYIAGTVVSWEANRDSGVAGE